MSSDYKDFQMPLAEAMTTQRAIRRIKPDPVDDGLVLQLIELALKGPTAQNQQQRVFIIVKAEAVNLREDKREGGFSAPPKVEIVV